MILEQAIFPIIPGSEADFEAAMEQAKDVAAQAKGFHSLEIRRSIENPSTYLGLIVWDEVDDHMVGFRESDLFPQWRALIGPFFASTPEVQHFELPVVVR